MNELVEKVVEWTVEGAVEAFVAIVWTAIDVAIYFLILGIFRQQAPEGELRIPIYILAAVVVILLSINRTQSSMLKGGS